MCSVSFQPGLPSASAAARASASTLSGTPDNSFAVGDVERPRVGGVEQVVVELRGEHRELFVHALSRAFCASGSSAPPSRKSRNSFVTTRRFAASSVANDGAAASSR